MINDKGDVDKPGARYAFFDVDGTIINIKSVLSYLEYIRSPLELDKEAWFREYYATLHRKLANDEPREEINRYYYTVYKGLPLQVIKRLGREWFEHVEKQQGFYNEYILNRLQKHRRENFKIVLVTGSFYQILEPLAIKLEADAVLCTKLRLVNGVFTGELDDKPCIGQGKAEAIERFAQRVGIDLARCCGYGDDITDIPMLNIVGYPMLVFPGRWAQFATQSNRRIGMKEGANV